MSKGSLNGKNVAILADTNYEDMELWYPMLRMKEAGAQVTVVGLGISSIVKSEHGYEVKVDAPASKVKADDFDAVIVPGGMAPDELRRHEAVLKFVKDAERKKLVIASICHGAQVLASAGILKGKTMTSVDSIKTDVINAGAKYLDQEVVVDGNFVTSRTPEDLPAFAREIIAALSK